MPDPCWNARPERRLLVALVASALLHALLSGNVTEGISSRKSSAVSVTHSAVHVRLLPQQAELPIAAAAAEKTPPPRVTDFPRTRQNAEAGAPARTQSTPATKEMGFEASDPTYYAARQLDVYPALLTALDFRVPRRPDTAGRVMLRVDIGATGVVEAVAVLEAEPAGDFQDDARRAFEAARFSPALKNGRPVKSRIWVHVDYGDAGTGSP